MPPKVPTGVLAALGLGLVACSGDDVQACLMYAPDSGDSGDSGEARNTVDDAVEADDAVQAVLDRGVLPSDVQALLRART